MQPVAKMGDRIIATDTHLVQPPGPCSPVPIPLPFVGILNSDLSSDVMIEGQPCAVLGSVANNTPPHIPPGGAFVNPPTNRGQIIMGSPTVLVNGKPIARNGDTAVTCNDPAPAPVGSVVAVGTVLAG